MADRIDDVRRKLDTSGQFEEQEVEEDQEEGELNILTITFPFPSRFKIPTTIPMSRDVFKLVIEIPKGSLDDLIARGRQNRIDQSIFRRQMPHGIRDRSGQPNRPEIDGETTKPRRAAKRPPKGKRGQKPTKKATSYAGVMRYVPKPEIPKKAPAVGHHVKFSPLAPGYGSAAGVSLAIGISTATFVKW